MGDMRFGDRRFGDMVFGYTYGTASLRPVQIMRQTISNNDMLNMPDIKVWTYHRYKGLSRGPLGAGYREDILDTKYSIYKHYRRYIPDMRIWGYEGLGNNV